MPEFKKQIEITSDDYVYFNKTHYSRFNLFRPLYAWLTVLFISISVFLLILKTETKYTNLAFYTIIFLFTVLLASAFIWIAYFILKFLSTRLKTAFYRWVYKKKMKHKECEFYLDEKGVHSENEKVSVFMVWDQISKIVENEHAFYLYYAPNAAFIFPRRYIASLDELSELQGLLKKYASVDVIYKPLDRK